MKITKSTICILAVIFANYFNSDIVSAEKPNVVIIYGDDVGYGDVGVYGSKMIPTPNIDKLAKGGLRFTDGHCSAATCTPSRYSLLAGIHGFRDGVSILPPDATLLIPTDILTLPKLFKKAGYNTGVVGKWHLGLGSKDAPADWNGEVKPGPLEIGFDYSFLLPSTNDRVPCVYLDGYRVLNLDPADPLYVGRWKDIKEKTGSTQYPNGKLNPEAMTYYKSTHGHSNSVINGIGRIGYMAGGKSALWDDETMADVFVEKAKAYISENKDKPFFLYFASQDTHVPRAPHPRFKGKTELSYRGDAMVQFDWSTGEIMNALEKHGLTENTIVIFSSDNGPVYDDGYDDGTAVKTSKEESDRGHDGSGIYRGGKYQIYEGGTRVPFIIRWPARIKPGVSDALVNQIDFLASFASLLNIELSSEDAPDSRDTMKAFLGQDPKGLDFMIEEANRFFGFRKAEWKYITGRATKKAPKKPDVEELYNLKDDPGETVNLIETNPEMAQALKKQLDELVEAGRVRK
ncbi:MAG: arylsulfatase [Verrucomicrobiota bacterium]